MVPAAAWQTRGVVRVHKTRYRPSFVVRVVTSFKQIVRRIKKAVYKIAKEVPKIIRRTVIPFSQGPPE